MPTVSYGIANTANDVTQLPGAGLFDTVPASGTGSGFFYWVGFRFLAVAVPQGATITSATLTLKKDAAQSVAGTWGVLKGVNADTTAAWTTTDPSVATKTSQSVTIVDGATQNYDVAAIVQAIVNRAGWVSGNALGFAGDPTGATGLMAWIDYDASTTNCAQLSITYTTGGGGTVHQGALAISGVGSITATASRKAAGTLTIAGVGTLASAGSAKRAGALAVSGVGAVSVAGVRRQPGALAVSGAGDVSVTPALRQPGTLSASGSGSVSVTPSLRQPGALDVSATGGTTYQASAIFSGSAAFGGAAAVSFEADLITDEPEEPVTDGSAMMNRRRRLSAVR